MQTPEAGIVPRVARSWEVLDGGRRYVFRLRDDARWSDGTPVTAADFEYAWKRTLDPATGSPPFILLHDIKGARRYHRGDGEAREVGVQAKDDVMLVVELERPTGYFLHLLAHRATFPVPRHAVEAHGQAWATADHIVTNGPFRLEQWVPRETVVLARDPGYGGRVSGNVQRVELSLVGPEDWCTALRTYEAGGLDIYPLWHPPFGAADTARHRHAEECISLPYLTTVYVVFDTRRLPFDDVRVRRAFVLASDRGMLADVVLHGYRVPATGGFVPPGMSGHSAGIALPYDPERARQLLAEAGYSTGRDFPNVSFLVPPSIAGDAPTEYLEGQWRENLGVDVTVKNPAGLGSIPR
jgi:oligopeptide transport system substrate-binding protein